MLAEKVLESRAGAKRNRTFPEHPEEAAFEEEAYRGIRRHEPRVELPARPPILVVRDQGNAKAPREETCDPTDRVVGDRVDHVGSEGFYERGHLGGEPVGFEDHFILGNPAPEPGLGNTAMKPAAMERVPAIGGTDPLVGFVRHDENLKLAALDAKGRCPV